MYKNEVSIGGYTFKVTDRKLVIENPEELDSPISIIFSPMEANQLSSLLHKLVPDDYGVRTTFRIPVLPIFGLKTAVSSDATSMEVETTSISMSGIYAEFKNKGALANSKVGDFFQLYFEFEDHAAHSDAVVTRRSSTAVAFAFATQEPSQDMANLIMAIQRTWISNNSL